MYIFESEISEKKSILFALMQIEGLGRKNSSLICKKLGFSINYKTKNLSKKQITEIIALVELLKIKVSSDLKRANQSIIKTLLLIKCYRGLRLYQNLPVRGQRTHTNAKTARKKLPN